MNDNQKNQLKEKIIQLSDCKRPYILLHYTRTAGLFLSIDNNKLYQNLGITFERRYRDTQLFKNFEYNYLDFNSSHKYDILFNDETNLIKIRDEYFSDGLSNSLEFINKNQDPYLRKLRHLFVEYYEKDNFFSEFFLDLLCDIYYDKIISKGSDNNTI